ncbi:tRNA(Ile)-lysidine synthetase [Fibrobacter sp. UWB1]|uniref:tRNA lysidine(34) synthetase n=1 Tax=Fibrobacter sp. UWB1 TaxID=1964355 RepID=UPI000B526E82|nr:tRNA lysidine(34) synthetase [Fibrobacter sp. UWB1]OWV26692.1 tRNA(Ile)-lysidine synthetase [Fibrobacter sp. UWB1]
MSLDLTQNIRRHGFKRLLLAVSGGLDSICLAHYFIKNRETLGIEWLGIAHVHHGLRVGTADRDAAFVEAFAKAHGVPFFLKRLDGESLKSAEGSLEENAREARYKALVEIALDPIASARLQDDTPHTSHPTPHTPYLKGSEATDPIPHTPHLKAAEGCDLTPRAPIVTAHHAGDQAETMYMRLRRGTTLAGLRGIQETRELFDVECEMWNEKEITTHYAPHITHFIYRPLLNTTRAELLAYARENNLEWCEDESNSDVKFARNKVRHEFLPQLEKECPGASMQLCRITQLADKAYAKVIEECDAMFQETLPLKQVQGQGDTAPFSHLKGSEATDLTPHTIIALNKKALRKILLAHSSADLSEMFRLWLSEQGFRFPIDFFYSQTEPAHVKIPVRAAYRKRSIVKKGSTILICEFESVEAALKFVSCK